MFFRNIERAEHYDAIIKDLPHEKVVDLKVSSSESHLLKASRGVIVNEEFYPTR